MTLEHDALDPRTAEVAAGYDALGSRWGEWSAQVVDPARDRLTTAFEQAVSAGGDVLDLGCGTGVPSSRRLAARYRVTGIDVSAGQIEAARRNVPEAAFLCADIGSLDFERRSFDGVAAFHAIYHLPRETHAGLLVRIASWLRPGGRLLATLGAEDSPDWSGPWLGTTMFFSSFDAATNRKLVDEAGFDVEIAEVVDTLEPEGPVPFLWVLGRRRNDVSRG